jgi:hypothetical protein
MPSSPGDFLFQGLSQSGQNIGQMLGNYAQVQQQDAVTNGAINSLIAQGPQAIQTLSPNGQALLQKEMQGKATRLDKMQLMGEITTSTTLKNQQAQQQAQLQNQLFNQRIQSLMNAYGPQGGGQQPGQAQQQPGQAQQQPPQQQQAPGKPNPAAFAGPQPAVSNYIQPPTPVTAADPQIMANMGRFLAMTGGDTDKAATLAQNSADAINKQKQAQYEQAVAVKKDTGRLVYTGPTYENGVPTMDTYKSERVIAPGTPQQAYEIGDKTFSFAHGVKPQQPVVFQPGQNLPDPNDTDTQARIAEMSPNNPNAEGWQKDLVKAKQDEAGSAQNVADAKLLYNAALAYTKGGSSQFNVLRGNPTYAKFQQLFKGENPQAALQTALSANTRSILAQVQSSQGGTVGGRMLSKEFENTAELLGNPELDNPTILAAAKNNMALVQRKYDIDAAYATYRETMPPAEAEKLAVKQFGRAPDLINPLALNAVPAAAIQYLKQNAANPQIKTAFDQKYGAGTSELALVK